MARCSMSQLPSTTKSSRPLTPEIRSTRYAGDNCKAPRQGATDAGPRPRTTPSALCGAIRNHDRWRAQGRSAGLTAAGVGRFGGFWPRFGTQIASFIHIAPVEPRWRCTRENRDDFYWSFPTFLVHAVGQQAVAREDHCRLAQLQRVVKGRSGAFTGRRARR